jgi:SAM-dependent methyltransferase
LFEGTSMSTEVADHYRHGTLVVAIERAIAALGKTKDSITPDDLAPVDEFHIGGRRASIAFLDQLGLRDNIATLDVGCGIGGASRFAATHYGAAITGIDLTAEYVQTGRALCDWLGLADRVHLHEGSATALPFDDASFERAFMMHVGMNIPDKAAVCREVARVLKPGGCFGIYDVMRIGPGELTFPVPWATTAATSALASPAEYRAALTGAGFAIEAERNRHEFALEFFEELKAKAAGANGPPPLGLHILMGVTAPQKVQNMLDNISAGRIAPVEMIGRKT